LIDHASAASPARPALCSVANCNSQKKRIIIRLLTSSIEFFDYGATIVLQLTLCSLHGSKQAGMDGRKCSAAGDTPGIYIKFNCFNGDY